MSDDETIIPDDYFSVDEIVECENKEYVTLKVTMSQKNVNLFASFGLLSILKNVLIDIKENSDQ